MSGQSLEELPEENYNEHEILDDLEIDDAIFNDSILISNDLKLKHRFKEYLKEKSKDSAVLSRLRKERQEILGKLKKHKTRVKRTM